MFRTIKLGLRENDVSYACMCTRVCMRGRRGKSVCAVPSVKEESVFARVGDEEDV